MTQLDVAVPPPPPGGLLGLYFRAMVGFAGVSMGVLVSIMLVQIVARYVFNSSLIWAEELCRYILVWQTFLLIGIAYHQGELAILDLLSGNVSPRTRLVIRLLVSIPVGIFLFLLIKTGLVHAGRFKAQVIPAVDFIWTSLTGKPAGVTVFWIYISVPVGCTILLLHLAAGIIDDTRKAFWPAPGLASGNGSQA